MGLDQILKDRLGGNPGIYCVRQSPESSPVDLICSSETLE